MDSSCNTWKTSPRVENGRVLLRCKLVKAPAAKAAKRMTKLDKKTKLALLYRDLFLSSDEEEDDHIVEPPPVKRCNNLDSKKVSPDYGFETDLSIEESTVDSVLEKKWDSLFKTAQTERSYTKCQASTTITTATTTTTSNVQQTTPTFGQHNEKLIDDLFGELLKTAEVYNPPTAATKSLFRVAKKPVNEVKKLRQEAAKKKKTLTTSTASKSPKETQDSGIEENKELFCICRQPNDPKRPYVFCDKCEDWFHFECVGYIPSKTKSSKYFCPTCR